MEKTQYLGSKTEYLIKDAAVQGRSIASYRQYLLVRISNDNFGRNKPHSLFDGSWYLSQQEAYLALRSHDESPRELIKLVQQFQADIAHVEAYPERWTGGDLTPERAKEWYREQIKLLQQEMQGS
jgi:hypothetical protein